MSYAAVGDSPYDCGPGEVWTVDAGHCIPLVCERGKVPYYGQCLSLAEQQEIASCWANEVWDPTEDVCWCRAGYTRSASGQCVPAASLPSGAPRGPAVRPASAAAVGARLSGVELVAVGAALTGAAALAWWHYGG